MDPSALTCAHRTLPLGSYLQVENLENGRRLILRINDRGPFIKGRVVDVTRRAAQDLGFLEKGLTEVRIKPVQGDGSTLPAAPYQERDNPYVVQVAALSEPANIERLAKDLRESYGKVMLLNAVDRDGHPITRVQVGSYSAMEDAEKIADDIAKRFGDRGVEPFITRRR
jgi:rare lipoprotein A